jgi:hypothetical protein
MTLSIGWIDGVPEAFRILEESPLHDWHGSLAVPEE